LKKGILYVVTAVLLGVAIMLTPLWFLSTSGAFQQPFISRGSFYLSDKGSQEAFARNELAVGVSPQYPLDEISVGLMSVFSLVLSFAIFKQSRKRTA